MKDMDVTEWMELGAIDDEALVILKCVCGARFNSWDFFISMYPDTPYTCDKCHRKFYFKVQITVYEVGEQ